MSIQVYVVIGSTGEYSDYMQWYVCAYQDKSRADKHAQAAYDEAVKIDKERKSRYHSPTRTNPYDPKMRMDYTGTKYCVDAVDLLDAIPGIDD